MRYTTNEIELAAELQRFLSMQSIQPITDFIKATDRVAEAEQVFRIARRMKLNVCKHYGIWYENGQPVKF